MRAIGVAEGSPNALPASVRSRLSGFVRVSSLFDENRALDEIVAGVRGLQIDRVESLWEPCVVLAARVREALGIPGMSPDVVNGFRDKILMKDRVARAGLRVPKNACAHSVAEVRAAIAVIGYPVILKPTDGAGTRDTYKIDSDAELDAILPSLRHLAEVDVEEFIDGEEFTYDTICVDGTPVFESVAQYHPKPLESRTQEWISPAQLVFRDSTFHNSKTASNLEVRVASTWYGNRFHPHGVVPEELGRSCIRRDWVPERRRTTR